MGGDDEDPKGRGGDVAAELLGVNDQHGGATATLEVNHDVEAQRLMDVKPRELLPTNRAAAAGEDDLIDKQRHILEGKHNAAESGTASGVLEVSASVTLANSTAACPPASRTAAQTEAGDSSASSKGQLEDHPDLNSLVKSEKENTVGREDLAVGVPLKEDDDGVLHQGDDEKKSLLPSTGGGDDPPAPLSLSRPPPQLQQSAAVHVNMQRLPGAYAEASPPSFRNPDHSSSSSSSQQRRRTTIDDNSGTSTSMVEATPVKEEDEENKEDLMEAQPVTCNTEGGRRPKIERRAKLAMIVLATIIPLLAIAIVVGVLVKQNRDKTPAPTPAPSTYPSEYPSSIPSTAPSNYLDVFVTTLLPDYTQQSLLDPLSPQSMALDWLSSHQNVTRLEDWRITQLFAIATFYHAMGGPSWPKGVRDHWLDDTKHECDWFSNGYGYFQEGGSYVVFDTSRYLPCNEQQEFAKIYFDSVPFFHDAPYLPPEIALLTSLTNIWLVNTGIANSLANFLPDQLYNMSSVGNIFLSSNALSGTIPTAIASMPNLFFLEMSDNLLTGTIPSEIASMPLLSHISVRQNFLVGTIPSEFFYNTKLNVLDMRSNLFQPSTLPTQIGLLKGMRALHLQDCNLFGGIPTEIGTLPQLIWCNLQYNDLSGSIPSQMGRLPWATGMEFNNNQLTGKLPTELGLLALGVMGGLSMMRLQDNALTGSLPSELGLLHQMEWLDLHDNAWTGTIPTEFGLLTDMTLLDLSNSELTGPIPVELGPLATHYNLTHFHVQDTMVSGIIPEGLCKLEDEDCQDDASWLDQFRINGSCTLKLDCDHDRNKSQQLCGCHCGECGSFSHHPTGSMANNNTDITRTNSSHIERSS